MRELTKRVLAATMVLTCTVTMAGFGSRAATAVAPSDTKLVEHIKNKESISPLEETWGTIPAAAAVAADTQQWYGKALANTDGEADVLAEATEGSSVVGKLYRNTLVSVEEKGTQWSRIASAAVNGYVKNEMLAFGKDAVERAKIVCPEGAVSNGKTVEELAAEEAMRREEAARQAAEAEKQEAAKAAVKTRPSVSASTDEQTLLAALIFCEAGNQPYEGQVAVGAVIMNRVRSGEFANTITGVIYEAGQFGPAITGKLDRVMANGSYTDASISAAADALAGANPIGSALYFGNGNYGQLIGDHYFH
ncbi:MAG: cell wall hydrolase [Lachnospiraceae bacterium]